MPCVPKSSASRIQSFHLRVRNVAFAGGNEASELQMSIVRRSNDNPRPMITTRGADLSNATFDFVIAGGGTAGLALAARLSENPLVTVAVLEAGEGTVGDPKIAIPAQFGSTLGDPKYDWCFHTTK
ncbi:putative gmc oxidoreductase [Lyophyllum shimeji]|uniref:Gmc oxidoreductase n=1 Tax=Lyophyllum shimeji TaxID=47721 RepID=A0A9P3PWF7_LYOSH|nr:putative gmc oxidoreductase [Lyophyllum shimeji]